MSRNIVPRVNKDADLGTSEKNWNKLYADAVILRGSDLKSLLDGKTNLDTLAAKGDLYVATDPGLVTRLSRGTDGYVLRANSLTNEGLEWSPGGARQELTSDITVTVGSGGDYSTINDAIESVVALYYPIYLSGGICPRVTIQLLSGFVMSEQVLIESLDLSWITITGEDSETVINRAALTRSSVYFNWGYPAFAAFHGGFLPIIGQLFNMDTSGSSNKKHGVLASHNSRAVISAGCGVKNAGSVGIYARHTSIVNADYANVSGSTTGIQASECSTVNANNANISNATGIGIYALSGSVVNATLSDTSGAGNDGIYVSQNSTVNVDNANISNAGRHGINVSSGSTVNANSANISNATECGIRASSGSVVNATLSDTSGAGDSGIRLSGGGIVVAYGATGTLSQAVNTITTNGIIFQ